MVAQSRVGGLVVLVVVLVAVVTPERLPEHHPALLLLLDRVASAAVFEAALEVRAAAGSAAVFAAVTEVALVEDEEVSAIKAAVALGEEVGMPVLPLAMLRTAMATQLLHLTLHPDLVGIAEALAEALGGHLQTET